MQLSIIILKLLFVHINTATVMNWIVTFLEFHLFLFVCWIVGGHINPAVSFGLLVARKITAVRAVAYMVSQCLGAICGAALVKAVMRHPYSTLGGGANSVAPGYSKGTALGAEIIGTFILMFTVLSAIDVERRAHDSFVSVCINLHSSPTINWSIIAKLHI